MPKRMLIDATHDEETRVAVIDNKRLDEYDYESTNRKPLKGSIFLAKVTRVEPSLQAAFVNFGGNRHGFLPFSEIHPDYFRIPIADREALIAEQEEALKQHEEEEEAEEQNSEDDTNTDTEEEIDDIEEEYPDDVDGNRIEESEEDVDGNKDPQEKTEKSGDRKRRHQSRGRRGGRGGRGGKNRKAQNSRNVETVDGDDYDGDQRFRFNLRRQYKIQEVIKRGQIMLVQVSKEERGNKGAAVSSYLSLPGRYCVLMPNSPRAGGVSRKIANYKDRAKMRDILKELNIPKGMSVIVRTAGVSRTKAEIKRDLDYLTRLWDNIRELTLQSSAPALVYEEADLIKRAIRDLYTRDVEEVLVAGEEGFKNAKNFMKMMIPSHVKRVQLYEDDVPLFHRHQVESQIAEIGETQVTLPSGGYLVINPTEALVAVDVNSGKATKERHIEETALKTNLESAEEVARQLRLRDLGGLVVVDFIDMEVRRNNGKVERKMREALANDRARVQVGRISSFGLMELSRQRLNPSLTESQYDTCPHCGGLGRVRTCDAAAIIVLRAIETEGMSGRAAQIIVNVPKDVSLYLLNNKREKLAELEKRYNFTIQIRVDESLGASGFRIEVARPSGKGGKDVVDQEESGDDKGTEQKKGRRRGRRGGRRRGRGDRDQRQDQQSFADDLNRDIDVEDDQADGKNNQSEGGKKTRQKSRGSGRARKTADETKARGKETKSKKEDSKKTPAKKDAEKRDKVDQKADKKAGDTSKAKKSESKPKSDPESKAPAKKKSPPSNDDKPLTTSKHEKVNEAPEQKKKGWWNKLGGE